MKLATYTANGQTRTGIVVGDAIIDSGKITTMGRSHFGICFTKNSTS